MIRVSALTTVKPSILIAIIGACLATLLPDCCWAVEDDLQAAEKSLRKQPWYDAVNDEVKPINLEKSSAAPTRSNWTPQRRRADWNWNWGWPFSFGDVLTVLGWCFVIAIVALLIYALAQTYLNLDPVRTTETSVPQAKINLLSDEERIENLPVKLRKKTGDLLALAMQNYHNNNFSEAMVYLFSHRLVQLDKAGLICLMKGKTNREYLSELQHVQEMQMLLGHTMSAFEDVFFGHYALDRERFEGCWNHNEQFQRLIQRAME